MMESQLEKRIEKIRSNLEKSNIVDSCCEIAKEYGKHEQIYGTDLYNYFYKGLSIVYIEDKEVNNIESGKEIGVRFQTVGNLVLQGKRDEIGLTRNGYKPVIDSEFGRFCILKYLPRGGWERLVKKVKKKEIRSEEILDRKEKTSLIKDFKENFG